MHAKFLFLALVCGALVLPVSGHGAERGKAKVECKPAGEKLVYDCMIMIMGKRSGKPIEGVKVVVGADMPAMPMAHNVKPVEAMAMDKPGMYHARLHLAMEGEWVLTLDLSGATRDRIVHTMRFGSDQGMMKEGMKHEDMKEGGMKHDKMKQE